MEDFTAAIQANQRRAWLLVAAVAVPVALVVGLICLAVNLVVAVVVFLVLLVAVGGAIWGTADGRAASALGGQVADEHDHARLINLVDGLCAGAGVSPPRLVVVQSNGLNALAMGLDPKRATLAVTSGLLNLLSVIELEGVLAEELVRIKRRDTAPGTVAAGLGPLRRLAAGSAATEERTDISAVTITRYPPGLASALEKLEEGGTRVPAGPARLGDLWLADPTGSATSRAPLTDRVAALREL